MKSDASNKATIVAGGARMIIVFEGLDNSGKTTQAELLLTHLIAQGHNVILSKELTTDVGRLLKSSFKEKIYSPIVKSYLFAADRQIRIEELQLRSDFENSIVIFDRYKHSAIAYRKSEGIDPDWVSVINKFVLPYDIGIYFDITPEESVRRNRADKMNIHYDLARLHAIRETYLDYVNTGELKLIDGTLPVEDVTKQILKYIEEFIDEQGK